jgi:hypothetical protein
LFLLLHPEFPNSNITYNQLMIIKTKKLILDTPKQIFFFVISPLVSLFWARIHSRIPLAIELCVVSFSFLIRDTFMVLTFLIVKLLKSTGQSLYRCILFGFS